MPVSLLAHLAHATLQAVAGVSGADVLHIKGPSVDSSLRPPGSRPSMDADILVRPSHLARLQVGLRRYGWVEVVPLRSGGVLHHSTNWFHPQLGQADIHVRFPGIQARPQAAFDLLWAGRSSTEIAHFACVVPNLTAQRLILLLHAARDRADKASDIHFCWHEASTAERAEVAALARRLDAEVALAAATGGLERYRDRPEYDLWRMFADGTILQSGPRKLIAEVKAVPAGSTGVAGAVLHDIWRVLVGTPATLATLTARRPTMREVSAAYRALIQRTHNDVVRFVTGRLGRHRGRSGDGP